MMGVRGLLAGALLAASFLASPAGAEPSSKPRLLFTTPDGFSDSQLAVAAVSSGYVVAWVRTRFGGDGASSVLAQRFTAKGESDGELVTVEEQAAGYVLRPQLLNAGKGDLLVAWSRAKRSYAAYLDAATGKVGEARTIAKTKNLFPSLAVAGLKDGFAVAARVFDGAKRDDTIVKTLDDSLRTISGAAVIERDKPNFFNDEPLPAFEHAVASYEGGAAVAYHGADDDIHGVLLDRKGKPGRTFKVSSTPGVTFKSADLRIFSIDAMKLAKGGFAAAWLVREDGSREGYPKTGVRARAFGPNGRPTGPDFRVDPKGLYAALLPVLAPAAGGGFAVGYVAVDRKAGKAYSAIRFFDRSGEPRSGEVVTEDYASFPDLPDVNPVLTRLKDGGYVSVFGVSRSIYADRFGDVSPDRTADDRGEGAARH